jgi:hypothetical protein
VDGFMASQIRDYLQNTVLADQFFACAIRFCTVRKTFPLSLSFRDRRWERAAM